jgi:hypothetical protein
VTLAMACRLTTELSGRQAGGKFAYANLMTVWWVRSNDWLGVTLAISRLVLRGFD